MDVSIDVSVVSPAGTNSLAWTDAQRRGRTIASRMPLTRDLPFTLRQLQYVLAVADARSFGAAARRCAVSQPSLSAQVGKLEEQLGVVLFDRLPREVRPTEAGAELLVELRRILQLAVQLNESAQALADPGRITLRIGVIPTIAPYLLPDVVAAITEQLPGLTVHWHEARTPEIEARLLARDLHAGLLGGPPGPTGLVSRALGREPFVLIVPARSAYGPGPVSLDQLEGTRLLLLEEGHCLRDQALDVCMRFDLPEAPFRATSLATLVQMVGAGGGVTLLPRGAVATESARAAVREVPLVGIAPARTLHLAWHPAARQVPALEDLATRLTRVVAARFPAPVG